MYPLKKLKESARKMKDKPTLYEEKAYKLLDEAGFAFRSQQILGFYILDILIPNRLLVVELDGPIHKKGNLHDTRRDEYCRELGLEVLRMKNEQYKQIVQKIKQFPKIRGYKEKVEKILAKAAKQQRQYEKEYKQKYDNRRNNR